MDQEKPGDRRERPRYPCEGKAKIHVPGAGAVIWGTVTDLSASGCYVELASPLALGQVARFALTVLDTTITIEGKAAVVHPMVGMGVAFTSCPKPEFQKLQEVLYQLSGLSAPASIGPEAGAAPAAAPPECPPGPAGPPPLKISPQSAYAILDRVVKHLSQNGVLTKEEFLALLKKK